MTKINLLAIILSVTLVFSSCSNNEALNQEEQSLDLLKTFTIKRDLNGAYSLDYNLNDNAETESIIDKTTNTNNIYLYSTDINSSKKLTQGLSIEESQLKVGFIDTSSDKKQPNITIIDDNIVFARGENQQEEMLSEYSITSNEDGTYTLDFTVKDMVEVNFIKNEESKIYEVHLQEGSNEETVYSRILEKEEETNLQLDFVNHIIADNTYAKTETTTVRRKPRTIIGNGE